MTALNKQALRERYSEKIAPKCQICGAVMTIQRAGAGGVVYGCTGRIDKDGEGYKFAEGRDFADNHYALSRVTVANNYNPDVLELLDELEAAEKLNAELEAMTTNINIPDGWALVPINPSMAQEYAGYKTLTDTGKMSRLMKTRLANIYRAMINAAAGIGVKGE
ncbi:ead/Ea22-like family protein [Citrobacter werkmanii]|nr:ead/Ea22-like family protein [Citrobacter werkmanii]MBJ9598094.1 ead/Ea22-like family protein [Citrobacter werkmanii]